MRHTHTQQAPRGQESRKGQDIIFYRAIKRVLRDTVRHPRKNRSWGFTSGEILPQTDDTNDSDGKPKLSGKPKYYQT